MDSLVKNSPLEKDVRDKFISSLKLTTDLFESLSSCAIKERAAIISQDLISLDAVLLEKSVVLDNLAAQDLQTVQLFPAASFSQFCTDDLLIRPAYEVLKNAAASALVENTVNASLVQTRLTQISSAMRAIRSVAGVESVLEYRPGGVVRGENLRTRLGAG